MSSRKARNAGQGVPDLSKRQESTGKKDADKQETTDKQKTRSKPTPSTDTTTPTANNASSSTQTFPSADLPPEVAKATEMIDKMKTDIDQLASVFDLLGEKASQVADLTGDTEVGRSLQKLRDDMKAQDGKHAKGIKEVEDMIDDLLNVQILAQLESEVEAGIEAQIDQMVKQQVAEELKKHIPQEQQDELVRVKGDLEKVQRALHNSESRRANSELREDDPDSVLHTIYRKDGTVSPLFPNNLRALFSLDGETTKGLLTEYEQEVSDSREKNLNRFIPFCGVPYVLSNPLDDTVSYRSPTAIHHDYGNFSFF